MQTYSLSTHQQHILVIFTDGETSVPPSGKGKEVMNFSEDTPASQSELGRDEKTTKTMLQSHGDQIKKLAEVVEDCIGKRETWSTSKDQQHQKKTGTGSISRTIPELKSKSKMADSSLKRKLYFEEESTIDEMIEVHQDGQGSPFTYYTHSNAYMDGAEMLAV
ncbi:uncharacterized protein DS421_9g262560 [Arachis hypogaea]|nr:uncharacterized protein DS421_9g262560 [Arachis hypogaea]